MDPFLGLFCNFWIARPHVLCGVVCFGWVLGFSRLSNLLLIDAHFFVGVFCGEFDPGSG